MVARDQEYPPDDAGVTPGPVPVACPSDPLWSVVALDHRVDLSIFGLRLAVESNAPYIRSLVEEALGPVAAMIGATDLDGSRPDCRLRVVVEPTVTEQRRVEPAQWRLCDPDHMLMRSPGVAAWMDLASAEGVVYVEEFRLRAGAAFRHLIIRSSALYLLNRRDRHPIHASALRRGDAALVLIGSSGSGKSTLCYAASRAGAEVLTDDAVRVQHTPELRIWGAPGHVNLLDDARALFDELRGDDGAQVMVNGKVKHVIAVPITGPPAHAFARRASVCLLQPGRGPVVRESATSEEIVRAITLAPEAVSDASPLSRAPAAAALAARGGWKLMLSGDPREAVPHLLEMLSAI